MNSQLTMLSRTLKNPLTISLIHWFSPLFVGAMHLLLRPKTHGCSLTVNPLTVQWRTSLGTTYTDDKMEPRRSFLFFFDASLVWQENEKVKKVHRESLSPLVYLKKKNGSLTALSRYKQARPCYHRQIAPTKNENKYTKEKDKCGLVNLSCAGTQKPIAKLSGSAEGRHSSANTAI